MPAHRALRRDVHCIEPEFSLARAWRVMQRLEVRHLPVTWGRMLVGVVSDRELLLHGALALDGTVTFPTRRVGDVMTSHPVVLHRNASVAQLARLMRDQRLDAVPIVNADNALVGLVTADDLLGLLATKDHEQEGLPFEFVMHRPEELREAA